MADYYPLIARAVAGLDKSTGEARRALYDRARAALVTQLRSVTPSLSESDITRERLALEDSIRKVEAEAARQPRVETPRPDPAPPASTPSAIAEPKLPAPDPSASASSSSASSSSAATSSEPTRAETPASEPPETPKRDAPRPQMPPLHEWITSDPATRAEPPMPASRSESRATGDRPSLSDQGLRGFRDGVGDKGGPEEVIRQPPKIPRETSAAGRPPLPDKERLEPRFSPEELGPTYSETPEQDDASHDPVRPRGGMPRRPLHDDDLDDSHGTVGRGFGGIARTVIIVAILAGLGVAAAVAYSERARIVALYQSIRGPATQASRDTTQVRPKIADRIGANGQQDSSTAPAQPAAAVAQRVVLYEQPPNSAERKQYIGSVIWRTEMVSPGSGLPPDVAVKADVEIPERHLRMSWTMQRNQDQTPASHTIEIIFTTGADFPPGGIADVAAVLMEQTEQARGAPLAGLRVKVTNGFFLVGLSAVESDVKRNIQLLKERAWLDISLIYNDGNRALLAMEKGVPGDRVFGEAFAAWRQ
ncbi:MAG: hypothetical protein QOD40_2015 [Alphaproteobacteria bacterium]|nr:hypothetical protein [Alphaproteobacteria bacterium]